MASAWSMSRFDITLGRLAAQGWLSHTVYTQEKVSWWEHTMHAIASGLIWSPRFAAATYQFRGWAIRAALRAAMSNPVTSGVLLVFIGGYFYADVVDPEEGADNYTGFITGGNMGNDPNYWDTDENDSGYFNVGQNVANIMDWYSAQDNAEAVAHAEWVYIQLSEGNAMERKRLRDAMRLADGPIGPPAP